MFSKVKCTCISVQTQIRKDTRKSSRYDQTNDFAYLIETVGLVMQDVYPDGNCLFASICDQLRIRGDFSYTPKYLRRAAVNFLREHPNQVENTIIMMALFLLKTKHKCESIY